jgi:hypothetical protein
MTNSQLSALGFADNVTAAQAAADADVIYAYVGDHAGATAASVDQFAMTQWGADDAPARATNAIRLLVLQERLTDIGG